MRSRIKARNAAYDAEEARPLWKRYPLSILYTVGLALLVIAAAGLMLVGPHLAGWLADLVGLGEACVLLWSWLRLPAAVVLLMLAVAIIYHFAPNLEQPFRLVTPGSVLAVAAWLLASLGFSYYVSTFGDYGATYGGNGAVIVLLLYLSISSLVLLFGAEVNAEIYHRSRGRGAAGSLRKSRYRPSGLARDMRAADRPGRFRATEGGAVDPRGERAGAGLPLPGDSGAQSVRFGARNG